MTLNIAEATSYEKINIENMNYIVKRIAQQYETITKEQVEEMRIIDNNHNAYAIF